MVYVDTHVEKRLYDRNLDGKMFCQIVGNEVICHEKRVPSIHLTKKYQPTMDSLHGSQNEHSRPEYGALMDGSGSSG